MLRTVSSARPTVAPLGVLVALVALSAWCSPAGFAAPGQETEQTEHPRGAEAAGSPNDDPQFQRALGEAIFRKAWVSAPASTDSSDGLGPLYNARACSVCHPRGGRGRPPTADAADARAAGLMLRLSLPPATLAEQQHLASGLVAAIPEPAYGLQLQTGAIQGHVSEGRLRVSFAELPATLADGSVVVLSQPGYSIDRLGYGPLHPDTLQSPRLAPALIGLGLLEAIPDAEILAFEDPDDRNGDGISGRASRVGPAVNGQRSLGRFGWKGGLATVRTQVAEAFATDMGLSSALQPRPAGDCTPRQPLCLSAPDGRSARHGGHEVGDLVLDLVTAYVAGIAPREPAPAAAVDLGRGRRLFEQAQCALCHRPSLRPGANPHGDPTTNNTIQPYTDLLLHDMGAALADHRPEGAATGSEWRTAPLWSIGESLDADGRGHLLHDGRARNIEEAILWHGGEAQAARDAFAALPRAERNRLIQFVKSL